MTVDVEPRTPCEAEQPRVHDVLGLFCNPVATFLALALVVGMYLACVVPHFGGIDEPSHFYRSYQISTGTFLPQKYGQQGFSGACIPRRTSSASSARTPSVYLHHLISLLPSSKQRETPPQAARRSRRARPIRRSVS